MPEHVPLQRLSVATQASTCAVRDVASALALSLISEPPLALRLCLQADTRPLRTFAIRLRAPPGTLLQLALALLMALHLSQEATKPLLRRRATTTPHGPNNTTAASG